MRRRRPVQGIPARAFMAGYSSGPALPPIAVAPGEDELRCDCCGAVREHCACRFETTHAVSGDGEAFSETGCVVHGGRC